MKYLIFIIQLMFCCPKVGNAQMYSGQASGNFIVYSIQSLTITPLGGVVGLNTPNDYFNGVTSNHYANLKVKSNANWIVSFSSQSTNFTGMSNRSSTDMPASVMGVRLNGSNKQFIPLSTQSQQLTQGNKGSSGNKHDFDIDVNFNPGFDYSGGLYGISIIYTLTKQ